MGRNQTTHCPVYPNQAGLFLPQFLTASYVGTTLGVENLDGFTLGNLMSNLMTLSVLQGLFTANDTLNPQAFGAGNYKEVGLLAIRGFVVCTLSILPSNVILFFFMDPILVFLKQNPITSELATRYYRVLMIGLPFYILYTMQWKFLAAQEIMKPLLIVTIITCGLMPLLLHLCVSWFGFLGSALSLVVYLALQSLLVLLYLVVLKPHHPETWSGLKIKEALEWNSVKPYLVLASGGLLASCERWFWEILSLVIGSFGVIPLSIHTIPTQLLTMIVMLPVGVGLALSVRIGATISHDVKRAKDLTFWCSVFITVLISFMTAGLWVFRKPLILMFSSDPLVVEVSGFESQCVNCRSHANDCFFVVFVQGAMRLWWQVCVYLMLVSFFYFLVPAISGLGMQWTVGIIIMVTLWILTTPAVVYFAIVRGGGLYAAWACLWPPYIAMVVVLVYKVVVFDWEGFSQAVRVREGLEARESETVDETTHLLL